MRSPQSKLLLLFLLAALSLPIVSEGKRRKITHKSTPLQEIISDSTRVLEKDSATLASGVRLSGYDKTRDASRESIFATNLLDRPITSLELLVDYRSMQDTQLHRRSVTIPCYIPPGQTRRLDFSSWDRQNVFYYHGSPAPKRAQATPYDVAIRILAAALSAD